MGQALDRDGNVLGEVTGESKREVFDRLNKEFKDAHEIRIRTLEAAGAAGSAGSAQGPKAEQAHAREAQAPQAQKPSIGRIVLYNHPGSADGRYPPSQSPAIIQHVAEDGSVRLFVFGPKGQHMDDGLTQGDGPCQWNWPPRV